MGTDVNPNPILAASSRLALKKALSGIAVTAFADPPGRMATELPSAGIPINRIAVDPLASGHTVSVSVIATPADVTDKSNDSPA
jgi:hypothetical protein